MRGKFLRLGLLAVLIGGLLSSCGKQEEDLVTVDFTPQKLFILPGKTYGCKSDFGLAPDLAGPYIRFGRKITNVSKDGKILRLVLERVKFRSGALTSELSIVYNQEATPAAYILNPAGFITSDPPAIGGTGCIEPIIGFAFRNEKSQTTLSGQWEYFFTIENAQQEVQDVYIFNKEMSATWIGN